MLLGLIGACLVLAASTITLSCSDTRAEETSVNLLTDEEQISQLFALIDSKTTKRAQTIRQENSENVIQKVISFVVIKDNKSGQIGLANLKEEGYFPFFDIRGNDYVVTCSGGSNGDWEKECGSAACAISASKKCLDEGGCAQVCQAREEKIMEIEFNAEEFLGLPGNRDFTIPDLEDFSAVEIWKII